MSARSKDTYSRAGAERIADRVREYWRTRGHEVEVWIVEGAFHMDLRFKPRWVRSNLINGLPPEVARREAAE